MTKNIISLGDELDEKIHKKNISETENLFKLLVEIYDQKNLAIKLNELNFQISRENINKWCKDKKSVSLNLDQSERNFIRKHLLPLKPIHWDSPDFKFIDLFAGIGGIRKGFEEIGGKCVFTSEWDSKARRTYLANHYVSNTELPYFLCSKENNSKKNRDFMDITKITLSDTSDNTSHQSQNINQHIPEHDILLAGFPCQPFSIAGVSKKNSLGRAHGFNCETQGTLFFDVKQILEVKKSKFFILENVKNLKSHDSGNTFATIIRTLDEIGYWIADISNAGSNIEDAIKTVRKRKDEPTIIDASHFLPQHRERIILLGIRKDLIKLVPELKNISLRNIKKPTKRYPLSDILCELSESDKNKYTLTSNLWNYLYHYALKHQSKGNGFGFGIVNPKITSETTRTLSARYYKDGSEILINQSNLEPDYLLKNREFAIKKNQDRETYAVSETHKYISELSEYSNIEFKEILKIKEQEYDRSIGRYAKEFNPLYKTPRRLTPKECARLMGFEKPEKYRTELDRDFKIVCPDTSAYKQFGNSVVVPVFKAVADLLKPYINLVANIK